MDNIKLFLTTLLNGLRAILKRFYIYLIHIIKQIPFFEKWFSFFSFALLILLLQRWRWYEISFDKSFNINHSIYTDDLLIFFILIFLLGFSSLIMIFSIIQKSHLLEKKKKNLFNHSLNLSDESTNNSALIKVENKILLIFRIFPLTIITIFFLFNLFFPERISPAKESSFSWQFYLFGLDLILCWMTGILGIKYYAQYS